MIDDFLKSIASINLKEILAEILVESTIKKVISVSKQIVEKENTTIIERQKDANKKKNIVEAYHDYFEVLGTEDEIYKQLNSSLTAASNWCENIQFKDLSERKILTEVFISLDFYLTPKSTHINSTVEQKKSIQDIISEETTNLIILGGPGAGKTTLSKYLCLICFSEQKLLNKDFNIPIVIRLRELNDSNSYQSLYKTILNIFGVDVVFNSEIGQDERLHNKDLYNSIIKRIAIDILDSLNAFIILDGFDEISNRKIARSLQNQLVDLSLKLERSRFILTSRTGEFNLDVENAKTLEICPLSNEQIEQFINKWITDDAKAKNLYSQIVRSPFKDTVIRPLNLAHLCALYLRYGFIPEKPKTVYKKIVYLLIEDWDLQRGLHRQSIYSGFTLDRKFEFLCSLAYTLTEKFQTTIFDKVKLKLAYTDICSDFNLPESEVNRVVQELESHTGLFLNSGFDQYEFSHKSLQEYLSAEYLVKSPHLSSLQQKLYRHPNEYAISIALSSDPNLSLYYLSQNLDDTNDCGTFLSIFITRLLLEKPDFGSSPYLALAIAKINTLNVKYHKRDLQIDYLMDSHDNVVKSFRAMAPYFKLIRLYNKLDDIVNEYEVVQHSRINYLEPNKYHSFTVSKKMLEWLNL